jgi:hypothetical protein
MFRQLLGNECALLSFFQCECQQNSPDDAEQDNIRKIPMNAVLPCFHSLDGHYRSMGQALARGEGNQRAVQRRLSGSQQQKGAERDKPTKFLLWMAKSLFAGATPLTTTNRSCWPYRLMSSCAASCCTCFRKVSFAFATSDSSPTGDALRSWHFAFSCSAQHRRQSNTHQTPKTQVIFGSAQNVVHR